jgi:hypothetical protein
LTVPITFQRTKSMATAAICSATVVKIRP